MGFSLTGTHVIYFIAAIIIASAVSGIFIAVSNDINSGLSETGDRIKTQLDTDFKIINDPDNIPNQGGNYYFYLKNIGGVELATTTTTINLFVDGEIITSDQYSFEDSSIKVGAITTIYIDNSQIAAGNHKLRVVGPQAVEDEFSFDI